jgi:hypothetical protein
LGGKEDWIGRQESAGNKNTAGWGKEHYDSFNTSLQGVGPAASRYNNAAAAYDQAMAKAYNGSENYDSADLLSDSFLKVKVDRKYEDIGERSANVKNSMAEIEDLSATVKSIGPTDDLSSKIADIEAFMVANTPDLSIEMAQWCEGAIQQLRELRAAKTELNKNVNDIIGYNNKLKKATDADKKAIDAGTASAEAAAAQAAGRGLNDVADAVRASQAATTAKRLAALSGTGSVFSAADLQNNIGATFREQCILQANIINLMRIKRNVIESGTPRSIPYASDGRNKALDIEGEPYGFMNKLTQPSTTAALFTLPNTILSQLQPYIRLYKIGYDEDGKDAVEIPVEFPSHFGQETSNITSLLRNSKRRGHGVGLKSFNFSYDGSDPFAVKKSIKASLEIFAASFEELMQDRGGYAYSDLALKTGTSQMRSKVKVRSSSTEVDDNLSKLNFRLKAVVGYSYPKSLVIPSASGLSAEQVKKAIYNSFVTLNLTPTIHEFNFDDTGRVVFRINYLAYIEDYFDQAYFNIFSDIRATKNTFRRRMMAKAFKYNCQIDKLKVLKEQEKKETTLEIKNSMQTLLGGLFEDDKIYGINIPYDDLMEAALNPAYDLTAVKVLKEPPPSVASPEGAVAEASANPGPASGAGADPAAIDIKKANPTQNSNRYEQIAFFYLDDLIDIVLGNIEESLSEQGYQKVIADLLQEGILPVTIGSAEKLKIAKNEEAIKRLRLVLGPIEIRDPMNAGSYTHASLGDIPISAKYFVEWLTDKVLAKGRIYYSLSKFINDFVKNYLRNFLNDDKCYGQATKQRITFYNANITSYPDHGDSTVDEISKLIAEGVTTSDGYSGRLNINMVESSGLLNVMGKRDSPVSMIEGQEMNYMVFFAGRSHPRDKQLGDAFEDSRRGVFHYVLGRDSGIVKNIKLDRTTMTGLKELRFEQEGFDGLEQLREVYDVHIDTFAMPTVFPGTYIFVDPRGFAPETNPYDPSAANGGPIGTEGIELTKYGIGGYFMVTKAETRLREGFTETLISAKWVAGVESNPTEAGTATTEISSNPAETKGTIKCTIPKSDVNPAKRGIQPSVPPDSVGTNPKDSPDPNI